MIVCFLRHGKADPPDRVEDEKRQLLEEGRRELRSAATIWRRLALQPSMVLTSPRQRSIDSAQLFAEGLGLSLAPTVAEELSPGAEWRDFMTLLDRYADHATLVFVGHEPDLSTAVERMTGSNDVRLGEGGLCCVELEKGPRAATGILILLLDPAVYVDGNRVS